MIVTCRMASCPYFNQQGFCTKLSVVSINEMGMCSVIWKKKGQQMEMRQQVMPFTDEMYPKEHIVILDAEINNDVNNV